MSNGPAIQTETTTDARAAFRYPAFLKFQAARFFIVVATEMQAVAVGWQVYEITKRPLDLGLVGLAQFLPGIVLFLVSGHVADRFNRRNLLILCDVGFATCFALLLVITLHGVVSIAAVFAVLVLLGVVRSFNGPVSRAMLPHLVPPEHFAGSVAWASSIFQAATILGPILGRTHLRVRARSGCGVCVRGPGSGRSHRLDVAASGAGKRTRATCGKSFHCVRRIPLHLAGKINSWRNLTGSFRGVARRRSRAATRVRARNSECWAVGIGNVAQRAGSGRWNHGHCDRASPVKKSRGRNDVVVRRGFGLCTVIFGVSRSFAISLAALFLVGATDMVSVIVRATLIQVKTPDEMRGRVNAVDMIFIGASNELGQFESGITAQWFGAVPAVILGGIGAIWSRDCGPGCFRKLRRVNELTMERGMSKLFAQACRAQVSLPPRRIVNAECAAPSNGASSFNTTAMGILASSGASGPLSAKARTNVLFCSSGKIFTAIPPAR